MGKSKRPAEYGEILAVDIDKTTVDHAKTRNHAVAVRAALFKSEIPHLVPHERTYFLKRPGVQENVEPLPGGQFSSFVLLRNTRRSPAKTSLFAALLKIGAPLFAIVHE